METKQLNKREKVERRRSGEGFFIVGFVTFRMKLNSKILASDWFEAANHLKRPQKTKIKKLKNTKKRSS